MLVAHHRHLPRPLLPAAQAGVAADAGGLLVGADGPLGGALLATAARPGLADEAVAALRGDMDDALLVAQAEHAAVLAHQQVGRPARPEQHRQRDDRQPRIPPAPPPQAEPQAADRHQDRVGNRDPARQHGEGGYQRQQEQDDLDLFHARSLADADRHPGLSTLSSNEHRARCPASAGDGRSAFGRIGALPVGERA